MTKLSTQDHGTRSTAKLGDFFGPACDSPAVTLPRSSREREALVFEFIATAVETPLEAASRIEKERDAELAELAAEADEQRLVRKAHEALEDEAKRLLYWDDLEAVRPLSNTTWLPTYDQVGLPRRRGNCTGYGPSSDEAVADDVAADYLPGFHACKIAASGSLI
jgi:hypothetical protein